MAHQQLADKFVALAPFVYCNKNELGEAISQFADHLYFEYLCKSVQTLDQYWFAREYIPLEPFVQTDIIKGAITESLAHLQKLQNQDPAPLQTAESIIQIFILKASNISQNTKPNVSIPSTNINNNNSMGDENNINNSTSNISSKITTSNISNNNNDSTKNNINPPNIPQPNEPPIKITIQCVTREASEMMKAINGEHLTVLFKDFVLPHQVKLMLAKHSDALFGTIEVKEKLETDSSGKKARPSFSPPSFIYKYVPSSIEVTITPRIDDYISGCANYLRQRTSGAVLDDMNEEHLDEAVGVFRKQLENKPIEVSVLSLPPRAQTLEEAKLMHRFRRYLLWVANQKRRTFRFVEKEDVLKCLVSIKNTLIGVKPLCDRMQKFMQLFASLDYDIPHGILFYGPPGTGKTKITELLCEYLDVAMVAEPLAAGNFNKSYVGDSERMVNHLGERAKVIPWQMCVVAIDEIDGLAPTRSASASSHKVDLLSVILSIVGGNQNVKNLVLIGSTNRFDMMDEAFRRRINFKFFVGRPSFEARKLWIQWKLLAHKIPLGAVMPFDVKSEWNSPTKALQPQNTMKIPERSSTTINQLVALTINFSNDAMQLLLRMLHETRYKNELTHNDPIDYKELVWFVQQIGTAERIFLGDSVVPDVLRASDRIKSLDSQNFNASAASMGYIEEMLRMCRTDAESLASGSHFNLDRRCTHRMLVDFGVNPREQFSLQTVSQPTMTNEARYVWRKYSGYNFDNPSVIPNNSDLEDDFLRVLNLQSVATKPIPAETLAELKGCSEFHEDMYLVTIGDLISAAHNSWKVRNQLHQKQEFFTVLAHVISTKFEEFEAFCVQRLNEEPKHKYESPRNGLSEFRTDLEMRILEQVSNDEIPPIYAGIFFDYITKTAYLNLLARIFHRGLVQKRVDVVEVSNELLALCNAEYAFIIVAMTFLNEKVDQVFRTQYEICNFGIDDPTRLTREEVLYVLVQIAFQSKLETIYLIDNQTLRRNSATNDEAAQRYISATMEEAKEYSSSMVIFDLDSLAQVTKNFNSLTKFSSRNILQAARRETKQDDLEEDDEANFSYHVAHPDVLASVLSEAYSAPAADKPFWVVVLSEDLYLTSRFKQKFTKEQWPLSERDQASAKKQEEDKKQRICRRCAKPFTNAENTIGACGKHQLALQVIFKEKLNIPSLIFESAHEYHMSVVAKNIQINEVQDVRWQCCNRDAWSQGEVPCMHVDQGNSGEIYVN
eukprot:Phypoly_transcript_00932.p1 GENE.Phypoly_transcript_00932~~Phypoly_transcript_00932.p1  ORF type:complete len:1234 (+),score=229.03 Phypoly_transcript_00932:153-3854(+)